MIDAKENTFEKNYTTTQLLRDVWHFLSPYKGKVIFATIARFIADLVWLYPAWAFAAIVTFCTYYRSGDSLNRLWWLFAGWVAVILLRISCQYVARVQGFYAADHAHHDAQIVAMEKLFVLDMAWHENENAGNKMRRIARGGEAIAKILRIWINTIIEIVVTFIGTLIIIAFTDKILAGVTAIFLCVYSVISFQTLKGAPAAAQLVNAKDDELGGAIFEGMNTIRTVKVLSIAQPFLQKMQSLAGEASERLRRDRK